jgi:ribosomal protein S18 acetylase RimI-like enzyme
MKIREALSSDAEAMSDVLEELVDAAKRHNRSDPSFTSSHYIEHPQRVHCLLAVAEDGKLLGFQSLKRADEGNPYGTPVGWGIIGTHVRPSAARMGIGSALFAATLAGARKARLPAIEAYIGDRNDAALAYYDALGFATYRRSDGIVCKALHLTDDAA